MEGDLFKHMQYIRTTCKSLDLEISGKRNISCHQSKVNQNLEFLELRMCQSISQASQTMIRRDRALPQSPDPSRCRRCKAWWEGLAWYSWCQQGGKGNQLPQTLSRL